MIIMTKKEFENIYRQHYAKMYCLAKTMLYDADESKDVVSEIFARLLRDGDRPQKSRKALLAGVDAGPYHRYE